MQLLPLERLGVHERDQGRVEFGILLPWISAGDGNRLFVKLIHERDQFLQGVAPRRFELSHSLDSRYGDYWSAKVLVEADASGSSVRESAWGQPGRYLYRYELESPLLSAPLDWIVDPYAREFGIGQQSAFTLGYLEHEWSAVELTWKTPALRDLIVYELMLHEFAWNLDGAIERLPYLRDLGVNCIELMPIANVARSIDWGFEPIGPFGPDERFGKRRDVRRLIECAHELGIAVILDMIYGHSGRHFAYEYVYSSLRYDQNPLMGSFSKDMFGPSVDYGREFARDFFFSVNHYWLDRYHVDGIRYDCVPNYWDGPLGRGFANLVFNTYEVVRRTQGSGHWQRFFAEGELRLIQCAEQLEHPIEVVEKTYANCTWQNETLAASDAVAHGSRERLTDLGFRFGLEHYPERSSHNDVSLAKSAFQYLENHDHSRFLCRFGTLDLGAGKIVEGDRSNWYKLQPYIIGMLLSKGIPLIWQGQEIGECYDVPWSGFARIGRLRPVRWEFFYDEPGRNLLRLHRRLLALRKELSAFREGEYYFHNDWDKWQSRGLLMFSRYDGKGYALVALNFTEADLETQFWFPSSGRYEDALHAQFPLDGVRALEPVPLVVPSNYGCVWTMRL